jgi:nucleoside-diphosphate-sugar epimerase
MRIAILGASSQIARDLICSLAAQGQADLLLYVRDVARARAWLAGERLAFALADYADYGKVEHDAVINFVGVGDPQRAAQMGGAIFGLTQQFDDMVLDGLRQNPLRRYIFLSSGAAYGSTFLAPAGPDTVATIAINAIGPHDYYSVAKLHAECKHRALSGLAITDLRVFNYFSHTQELGARFFITDILRAIGAGQTLVASPAPMVRDYLHPSDFCQLVRCVLQAPPANRAFDCYSRAPIDKASLLETMRKRFGLAYEFDAAASVAVNATGAKPHYYSLNRQAAELGYQPAYSSADGLVLESEIILRKGIANTSVNRSAVS